MQHNFYNHRAIYETLRDIIEVPESSQTTLSIMRTACGIILAKQTPSESVIFNTFHL